MPAQLLTGLEGRAAAVTATIGPLAGACASVLTERGANSMLLLDGDRLPEDLQVLVAILDGAPMPLPDAPNSDADDWEAAVGGLAGSLYRAVRHAAAAMAAIGGGSIVVIAPEAGLVGVRGASVMAGAAGGLFAAARALAIEYARIVRINMISYSCVEGDPYSDWLLAEDPNGTRALGDPLTLLERLAAPEEVATAAAFLASDRASFIVAHQLVVDGGYVVH